MTEHEVEELLHGAALPGLRGGHEERLAARLAQHAPRAWLDRRVPVWGALAAALLMGAVLFEVGRLSGSRGGVDAPGAEVETPRVVVMRADLFAERANRPGLDVSGWSMVPVKGEGR